MPHQPSAGSKRCATSLEVGKVANVVVWSGDPFEFSTAADVVLIRGREVPLTSRQKELMQRYPRY